MKNWHKKLDLKIFLKSLFNASTNVMKSSWRNKNFLKTVPGNHSSSFLLIGAVLLDVDPNPPLIALDTLIVFEKKLNQWVNKNVNVLKQ